MRLRFIFAEVFHGIRRNFTMTVSVMLVTFISLTFVGAAALLQKQIGVMKDEWYDKVEISVFMCPDTSSDAKCQSGKATPEQLKGVEDKLNSAAMKPYVKEWYFETEADAFTAFKKRFADDHWNMLKPEQLPSSYRIKLINPEEFQVITDAFTGLPGVDEVQDQRKVLEPVFTLLSRASYLSAGLAALMLLTSVLLINTTIRLSAMSRKRETNIMRLVGASNLFIQLPFMLEGAIAALLGAGLAIGGLWLGVHFVVQDWLAGSMSAIRFVDTGAVWQLSPWLVLVALAVAGLSSLVTLRKFTRV